VSSPRESHPQALAEPDVNLSIHPAPIAHRVAPESSERTGPVAECVTSTDDSAPAPRIGTQALAGGACLSFSLRIATTRSYVPH
jgi:hypothetical protein